VDSKKRTKKPAVTYTHIYAEDICAELDPKRGLVVWRKFKPHSRLVLNFEGGAGSRLGLHWTRHGDG